MKCAECGSNLTLISYRGKDRKSGYYGCPGYVNRGICTNSLYVSREIVEETLLHGVRLRLHEVAATDYVVSELRKGLVARDGREQLALAEHKRNRLRQELERLADAIARSGGSETLIEALNRKEGELKVTEAAVRSLSLTVPVDIEWLRKRVTEEIEVLPALLASDPERARMHLLKHVTEIRMEPTEEDGRCFYVADGNWFTAENENVAGALLNGDAITLRMVAGARFELATFGL